MLPNSVVVFVRMSSERASTSNGCASPRSRLAVATSVPSSKLRPSIRSKAACWNPTAIEPRRNPDVSDRSTRKGPKLSLARTTVPRLWSKR